METNAEINSDSWINVSSEEKSEIVNKLKRKDAPSLTPSIAKILDDDDIKELNEMEEEDDHDPTELIKIVHEDKQEYLIKMLEDHEEYINPFTLYFLQRIILGILIRLYI